MSYECTTALQPGQQIKILSPKKKKNRNISKFNENDISTNPRILMNFNQDKHIHTPQEKLRYIIINDLKSEIKTNSYKTLYYVL